DPTAPKRHAHRQPGRGRRHHPEGGSPDRRLSLRAVCVKSGAGPPRFLVASLRWEPGAGGQRRSSMHRLVPAAVSLLLVAACGSGGARLALTLPDDPRAVVLTVTSEGGFLRSEERRVGKAVRSS